MRWSTSTAGFRSPRACGGWWLDAAPDRALRAAPMKPGVILAMEQALSMTSATLRFVHLGWRVIKVEATPLSPDALPGDPNRYIGSLVADEGRRSYFIGPNVGKESIALNLKAPEGQEV